MKSGFGYLVLVCAAALAGCDAGDNQPGGGGTDRSTAPSQPPPEPITAPILHTATPTVIQVGDRIQLLGQNFPDPRRAKMVLRTVGTFTDQQGAINDYEQDIPLRVHSDVSASAAFESVLFHHTQAVLGRFAGTIQLVAIPKKMPGQDEAQEPVSSEPLSWTTKVEPSIIVRRFRSAEGNCVKDLPGSTLEDTPLELEIEVIGIDNRKGELNYQLSFNETDFHADLYLPKGKHISADQIFNLDAELDIPLRNAEKNGVGRTLEFQGYGTALALNPAKKVSRMKSVHPPVEIAGTRHVSEGFELRRFATGSLEEHQPFGTRTFYITVTGPGGIEISRSVAIDIRKKLEIEDWDPSVEELTVKRSMAVKDSTCVCARGRDTSVTLERSQSLQTERVLGFRQDQGVNSNIGGSGGHLTWAQLQGHVGWSDTFSTDINYRESRTENTSHTISTQVAPNTCYVAYRQEVLYERTVPIRQWDVCGRDKKLGEAVLHSPKWGYTVEQDNNACSPPPPFNGLPAMPLRRPILEYNKNELKDDSQLADGRERRPRRTWN